MRNNLKKVSLFLSMVMLFVLASPLTVLAAEESSAASAKFYGTFWSLVPPLVAIALALITKEVYSSLFVGILVGALFYSNFSFEGTVLHVFQGGMISVLTSAYNMGILDLPGHPGSNCMPDEQEQVVQQHLDAGQVRHIKTQ